MSYSKSKTAGPNSNYLNKLNSYQNLQRIDEDVIDAETRRGQSALSKTHYS